MFAVVVDLETTGLADHDQIAQIGAVAVDKSWNVIKEFEVKVDFDRRFLSEGAASLGWYDPEAWHFEALHPREVGRLFGGFLRDHATIEKISASRETYKVARLVGHNASRFDVPKLRAFWRDNGLGFFPASFTALDTMQLALWRFAGGAVPGSPQSFSLDALSQHFGIARSRAHDALDDARTTASLAKALTLSFAIA